MGTCSAWRRQIGAGVLLFAICGAATAIEPYQEYRKRIESTQNLTALKSDLFGDSVSLYNGKTDFSVTDIDLPGNNSLPVRLQRRFNVELHLIGTTSYPTDIGGAGGWDVDVPYISGTFGPSAGWSDQRCSVSMVPTVNAGFNVAEVWQGNTIHVPGEGDRVMLALEASTPRPSDGISRKWTTAQRDAIDCIPMQSGLSGEGFRITTTSGIRYYFDRAVSRDAGLLEKSVGTAGVPFTLRTGRSRIYLLATKIEDRFGNKVEFEHDGYGHPTRIWSSDGRQITATYSGDQLASATTSGRTWAYTYGPVEGQPRLTQVLLPDGSSWKYGYSNAMRPAYGAWDGNSTADCAEQPPEVTANFTLTAEHPSGATGAFVFTNARHYRSGIHMSACAKRTSQSDWGTLISYELLTPNFFDVMTIQSKTIGGPGISQPLTWTYAFGGGYQPLWGSSGAPAVYPCASCASEKTVEVTNPDGTKNQYRYGFQYALNEGRLLGSSVLDKDGSVVRTEATRYMTTAEAAGQPFIPLYGLIYNGDDPSTAQVRPVVATTIVQEGTTYTSTTNAFDSYARPTSVTKASPSFSRTDATQYFDDTSRWVLEQVAKVTNTNTGRVVSQTSYDAMSLPYQVWSFGKLQQTITYNADGTAATVKDGRNNTTRLSSWKRGIPQSIAYADLTSMSAAVDDRGWIASVTDENGSVTGYGYDAMGRISSITYPTDSGVTWNTTTQAFQQIFGAEYGLSTGHWRQTVSTGNARKVVYFDAFWRPIVTREYDNAQVAATQRFQRFEYDHDGRTIFASYPGTTDALSAGTWTEYDALGRATSVSLDSEQGPLTTVTQYQAGNATLTTSPRGLSTRTGYQAFDQPGNDAPVWIQHPEGAFTDIVRDVFGKPKAITRRNADSTQSVTRSYVYDANEQLCKAVEPETGATVTQYDAAGNIAWTASGLSLPSVTACDTQTAYDSGRRADRTYDARNRVRTLTFPDSNGNQVWTYTNDGKPSQVVTNNDGGSTQVTNDYSYFKRGLIAEERMQQTGESIWVLGYRYDGNGASSGLVYPSGLLVDYAPNALGQPTKAGTYATGVSYYPNGGMKQFTYGNGIVHTMTQNARQLPSRVKDGAVLDDTYSYDKNGNVTQITDAVTPTYSRSMVYDNLDRLTQATSTAFGGDGIYRYTYDTLDNLRSAKLTGKRQHNYWYDASNRLTNIQDNAGATIGAIGYDLQGNVQNKSGQAFQFDYGNRLRVATSKESYRYDAYGRRVTATSTTNSPILSFYGQDGMLRRQDNRREGKNYEYVHLNGSLVAKLTTVVAPVTPALTVPSFSTTGDYTVSWSSVTYATSYQLEESANGGAWALAYAATAHSKAFSDRSAGSYAYRIRACQASACSGWSASQTVAVQFPPSAAPIISLPTTSPNGDYTVSWTTVSGAERYVLENSINGGAWSTTQDSTAFSVTYTSKAAGTYAYRVKGCNPAGCGPVSATATTQVIYPPASAPTLSVPAQSLTGAYTVSWAAVSGAATYRVEESVGGGAWAQVQETATPGTSFTGKAQASYSYRARACNVAGCGGYSATVTISVIRPPTGAPTVTVPSANSTGTYAVAWSGVTFATTYQVEESFNGGAWSQIHSAAGGGLTRSGRVTGSYGYRARACNAAGCGAYSATKSVAVTLVPAVPSITSSIKYQTDRSPIKIACSVSWTSIANADRYELWSYSGGPIQKQYDGSATSVSTSINQNVATYCAGQQAVRACNAAGCSAYSAPVTQSVEILETAMMEAPKEESDGE